MEKALKILLNSAHCADMYPSATDDLPQLKQARELISNLIGNWLKQD